MMLRREILAGGILLRPMIPLTPDDTPGNQPDLRGRSVFLAGGRHDPIVHPEETDRLAKLLQSYGAGVSLHWSGQGHELNPAELQAARLWLNRMV